jgi:putative transposase
MPRKARIVITGAFHHIMARGIDGRTIFCENSDYEYFLMLLRQELGHDEHRLYAWVLMPNHYHFLLRVSSIPLSEMMRKLNSTYARYYNKKYNRRGYLFQDRYKSIVTQDQRYVEEIIRYIHLNPVRAGICGSIAELEAYPWCGHRVVMGRSSLDGQSIEDVLRRFGKTTQEGRQVYRRYLHEGLAQKHDTGEIVDAIRSNSMDREDMVNPGSWVIGNPDFVKKVLAEDKQRKMRLARYCVEQVTLENIAQKVAKVMGVSDAQMRQRSRGTAASDARKVFAFICRREYGFPVKQIARYLGISGPPVSISLSMGEKLTKNRGIKINI